MGAKLKRPTGGLCNVSCPGQAPPDLFRGAPTSLSVACGKDVGGRPEPVLGRAFGPTRSHIGGSRPR